MRRWGFPPSALSVVLSEASALLLCILIAGQCLPRKGTLYLWTCSPMFIRVYLPTHTQVNEALNGLLVEEEDFEGLRHSITHHDNFDQVRAGGCVLGAGLAY